MEELKDNAWVREILDKYILPFDIYSLFKDGNDPKPDIQFLNILYRINSNLQLEIPNHNIRLNTKSTENKFSFLQKYIVIFPFIQIYCNKYY